MLPPHVVDSLLSPVGAQARAMAWSAVEAEELAQEAWLRLLIAWPKLKRKDRTPNGALQWMRSTLRQIVDERKLARANEPDAFELEMAGIL